MVPDVVEEEVEAVVHEIGPHGPAETVLVGRAVYPDDGQVAPARLIVGVRIRTAEHLVQDVHPVDVACVDAEKNDSTVQVLRLRAVSVHRVVGEERLPGREQVLLGREHRSVVVQAGIGPPLQPAEGEAAALLHRRVHFAELLEDGSNEVQVLLG